MSFYINYKKNQKQKNKADNANGWYPVKTTCSSLHSRTKFFLQSFPMDEIIMMMGHSSIFHGNDETIK